MCCDCEELQLDDEKLYHGQSSRTSYLRGTEHLTDFQHKREKSIMWKHCQKKHQGNTRGIGFRMDVVGVYNQDPMK